MFKAICAAIAAVALAVSADAAVVGSYDINNVYGTTVSGNAAAGVSLSPLQSTSSRPWNAPSNVLATDVYFTFGRNTTDYFEWTIAPQAGYTLTLNRVDLSLYQSHTGGVNAVQFVSDSAGLLTTRSGYMEPGVLNNFSLYLYNFNDITGPATFRVYMFDGNQGIFGLGNHSSGSFAIHGTVTAIPEPAMLAGAVLLVPLLSRRRQS